MKLAEYMARPVPAPVKRYEEPQQPEPPRRLEIGRKALENIRGILGNQKSGVVAGTWHHVGGRGDMDPLEWARLLRVREESGEHLSLIQRRMWREALQIASSEGETA